jgi:hypothetical protein
MNFLAHAVKRSALPYLLTNYLYFPLFTRNQRRCKFTAIVEGAGQESVKRGPAVEAGNKISFQVTFVAYLPKLASPSQSSHFSAASTSIEYPQ